jgi:serine/threonine protein kinase
MSLIAHVLHEEPKPPSSLNPAVPAALSALILRLLAKDPAHRVQSAVELSKQLMALG